MSAAAIAFSSDSALLAALDEQGRVTVYSNEVPCYALPLKSGWGAGRSRRALGRPLAVAWRPLSSDLALCFERGVVLVRKNDDKAEMEIACSPRAMAWHGRGRILFVAEAARVLAFDAAAPGQVEVVSRVRGATSLAWSDAAGLAVGGAKHVRVLQSLGEEVWTPGGRVSASWTADGKAFYFAGSRGLCKVAWPSKAASTLLTPSELADVRAACGAGGGESEPCVASNGEGLTVALCFGAPSTAVALVRVLDKAATAVPCESPCALAWSSRGVLAVATPSGLRFFEHA